MRKPWKRPPLVLRAPVLRVVIFTERWKWSEAGSSKDGFPSQLGPGRLANRGGQSGSRDTALAKHTQDVKEGREG